MQYLQGVLKQRWWGSRLGRGGGASFAQGVVVLCFVGGWRERDNVAL